MIDKYLIGKALLKTLEVTNDDLENFILDSLGKLDIEDKNLIIEFLRKEIKLTDEQSIVFYDIVNASKDKSVSVTTSININVPNNSGSATSQPTDDVIDFEHIREKSRLEYLAERETQQLDLAKRRQLDKLDLYKHLELDYDDKHLQDLKKESSKTELIKKLIDERRKKSQMGEKYVIRDDESQKVIEKLNELQKEINFITLPGIKQTNNTSWETEQIKKASTTLLETEEIVIQSEFGEKIKFVHSETNNKYEEDIHALQREAYQEQLNKAAKNMSKIEKTRRSLPIYNYRKQLMTHINNNLVTILVGQTGSGKTTQLAQYLAEVGYTEEKSIVCTQPRRVAAMSVAKRVADERVCRLGDEVGYVVRFDSCVCDSTKIIFMTDGILLQQFAQDPVLSMYSVVIIDEAHERSLHSDILLALIKDLIRFRKNSLRVIIASATLDADNFSSYFNNAPIFNLPGRTFPVNIYYTTAPEAHYIDACALTSVQLHCTQPLKNDILVFLPGRNEIEQCEESIYKLFEENETYRNYADSTLIIKLYGSLPMEEQTKVFISAPDNKRKIILSTNIAETSITIDNVNFVIDCGLYKTKYYDYDTNTETLAVVPCSKSSCQQRAGRAGRTKEGHCFRLFTKNSWEKDLELVNTPEIKRCNLTNIVLYLLYLGIENISDFDFFEKPSKKALEQAINTLFHLNLILKNGQLTLIGDKLARIPTSPQNAAMLAYADKCKCTSEILMIISMLEVGQSIFINSYDKSVLSKFYKVFSYESAGDHIILLNVFKSWVSNNYDVSWCKYNNLQYNSLIKARNIYSQLLDIAEKLDFSITHSNNISDIQKSIVAGYFLQCAVKNNSGSYNLINNVGTEVEIHPSSSIRCNLANKFSNKIGFNVPIKILLPDFVVYHEIIDTTNRYMKIVTTVEIAWLLEINSEFFKKSRLNTYIYDKKYIKHLQK